MKIYKIIFALTLYFFLIESHAQTGVHIALIPEEAQALLEFKPNEIWAISKSKIYKIDNSILFAVYDSSNFDMNPGELLCITEKSNHLWIGAENGIFKFDGQSWKSQAATGLTGPVSSIRFTSDGKVWFLSGGNLLSLDSSTLFNHMESGSALACFQNKVYLGTGSVSKSARVLQNGSWSDLPNAPTFMGNRIFELKVDQQGNLWSANFGGISVFNGQIWIDKYSNSPSTLNDLIVQNNVVYTTPRFYFPRVGADESSLIRMSLIGPSDSLMLPTFEIYNENAALGKGKNGSILIAKGSPNSIFRFFPSLYSKSGSETVKGDVFKASIAPNGDLFKNYSHKDPYQGFQLDSSNHFRQASIWIGGKDGMNDEKVAANLGALGTDFFSGPISNVYDSLYVSKYNRVWKITRSEIFTHKRDFNDPNYAIPENIKTWPGNGDVSKGEAIYYGPFIDKNFNGVYEPHLGEYPDIKGDVAIYSISNDDRGIKRSSYGSKMGVEVHTMIYAFDSISYPALNNSLFLSYKIVNRSNENYSDVKVGLCLEPSLDLDHSSYIGSDSVNDLFYSLSDDNQINQTVVGGLFLSDKMSGLSYFNYQSLFAPTAYPETIQDFGNFLNGFWKDGLPLSVENPSGRTRFNGDGHDPSGMSSPTRFAFNDAANWYQSWNDKASMLPILKFSNLDAGDFICFDLALIVAQKPAPNGNFPAMDLFKEYADSLKSFYADQNQACLGESIGYKEVIQKNEPLGAFPNPISGGNILTIEFQGMKEEFNLFDSQGKRVLSKNGKFREKLEIQIPDSLNPGLYLLIIKDGKGNVSNQKIIID